MKSIAIAHSNRFSPSHQIGIRAGGVGSQAAPGAGNGLEKASQVMVDKAMTVKRDKVGSAFGRVDADTLVEVERCLAVCWSNSACCARHFTPFSHRLHTRP